MSSILLTGATGVLGTALQPKLRDAGHQVRAASRSPPTEGAGDWVTLDLTTGEGMSQALKDIDVVVHAASDARGDSEAVDVRGTDRLVDAAAAASVDNFVYVSIVGIDEIPYSYYKHKLEAEATVESSDVPATIVRITQFYPFVASLLSMVARLPVWPLPTKFRLQPIDVEEAAAAVTDYATESPAGRVPDVGGPEVATVRSLAERYRSVRGMRRPIVRLPIPGATARAFRRGEATCPEQRIGERQWDEWLEAQTGDPGADQY